MAEAVIGGGVGGGPPLEIAGKVEPPLAERVLTAEGDENGAAAQVEGPLAAIKADGEEDGDDDVGENKVEVEEEEAGEEKWLNHYSSMHRILIVGDGDFSFSLALATAFGSGANLVATSLDTYEVLRGKYSKAESNIMELKRLGTTVLHGVDAKTMTFHTGLKDIRFDRIVFNFPHAGFKGKEDGLRMINSHKELMWYFFYNARRLLLQSGEIHVTHKTGDPYDKWDLKCLASERSLVLVLKVGFQKEDYPGYNQKRGDGARCDEPFDLSTACTFKFQIGDPKKMKKMNRNRARSESNHGGRNVHPGQWATDAGPPIEAWPPLHFPPPLNADHMPLRPYIADERQHTCFPLNSCGIAGAPHFHEHDSFYPTYRMPGPSLNDFPATSGIPPPVGRIIYPNLLPPPEQPWYEPRTIYVPPASDDSSYFAREYQRSLQREYDMRRHLMPGSTSLSYSAFLEHRHMESVKKQEWLRSMIALYGRR